MESVKLKTLLNSYLEGTTTLAQESQLRNYFAITEVAPDLAPFKEMFDDFSKVEAETYNKPVSINRPNFWQKPWQYGIAAILVIGVGVSLFMLPGDGLSSEERLAIKQYEEFKTHMQMISGELNNGIGELAYLSEFEKASEQIFK